MILGTIRFFIVMHKIFYLQPMKLLESVFIVPSCRHYSVLFSVFIQFVLSLCFIMTSSIIKLFSCAFFCFFRVFDYKNNPKEKKDRDEHAIDRLCCAFQKPLTVVEVVAIGACGWERSLLRQEIWLCLWLFQGNVDT